MMNCKEATQLMSAGQDRPLNLRERFALRMHLALCRGCRSYQSHMHFIRTACKSYLHRLKD